MTLQIDGVEVLMKDDIPDHYPLKSRYKLQALVEGRLFEGVDRPEFIKIKNRHYYLKSSLDEIFRNNTVQ